MILRYDGTLAGLLTVCQLSGLPRQGPTEIQRPPYPDAGLFDDIVEVVTDAREAAVLRDRIGRGLSPRTFDNVRLAFLSEHPGIEMMIWRYLALGWKIGPGLDACLAHPDVHAIHCWAGRTAREGHRLRGLARFRETADGTWYAPLYADANVLPLLAPHFARRLDRPWVLHDVRRSLGAIGEGRRYLLGTLEAPDGIAWSADELGYQELWRAFHQHIAIPDRISRRRQRQFMPLKYWEYLVEVRQAV
ncbi:MAG: DNA metabolism protein [Desulfuromonas sp.]|nr:DNA metabolism protein [Desulfuromonas sp.]